VGLFYGADFLRVMPEARRKEARDAHSEALPTLGSTKLEYPFILLLLCTMDRGLS
jgi:hypothetical protein